jgi:hypothetical protein
VDTVTAYLENELQDRRATSFEQHTLVCEGCARYLDQIRATITIVSAGRAEPASPARTGRAPVTADVYAYKFLRGDGVGQFSSFCWSRNVWVSTDGPPRPCRRGIHACTVDDLPYWLGEELWLIELAEPVVAGPDKLVSPAGRLDRRIAEWDSQAALRLARVCASRVTERAVAALGEAGLDADGARIQDTPEQELAAELAHLASRAGRARPACEYAASAAASLREQPFVAAARAAYAASLAAAQAGGADEQREERAVQAAWLARELSLAPERPAT